MRNLLLLIFTLTLLSCSKSQQITGAIKDKPLISYVNPFIGTGGHGHTYPGAVAPFGMMQLSPDTRLEGWDGCSGYHYSDKHIYGFSHTHLSGTGVSDYADVLLMPTNAVVFNNGADGNASYRSEFSHDDEKASPGFYKVLLKDTGIKVSLTVSRRSGMHKYEFPSAENQFVILDLEHRDKLNDVNLKIVSDTEISGYRFSKAWAANQKLFFNIQFSKPFKVEDTLYSSAFETSTKAALKFDNPKNEPVFVKVGISAVDERGAKLNLEKEIGTATFEELKAEIESVWEKRLERITVEDTADDKKTIFYTSLYHSMLAPHLHQDVDMRYRGMNDSIYKAEDFEQYTVFSLWDTYRAAHPLYTLIEQDRTNDFIRGFIKKQEHGGILPIWDLSNNYTGCMIGYHAIPVIADAYLKGIKDYDVEKAFQAMTYAATRDQLGLDAYKQNHYIPVEAEGSSVSKTLEYAYDDWAIAQMANALGKTEDYKTYIQRAQYYKNVYNPGTKFMQGRFRNTWPSNFDPYEVNFNYTEANSWQYSFYVPQDISGFTSLLGGKKSLEQQLDKLFNAEQETSGAEQADITGLIGQYAHGNEPSHHMAYLYNFVNTPHKTQERVHQILTEQYANTPDGISGNEDCGQMGAWYVFSALGFYPVTPVSNTYIIGTPHIEKATLNLENGNRFTVFAKALSEENMYIESATLNGKKLNHSYIHHDDIMNGGSLVFTMTNTPSNWATDNNYVPTTQIKDHLIVQSPYITKGDLTFKDSTKVALGVADKDVVIHYKTKVSKPYRVYKEPFYISETTELEIYGLKNNEESPKLVSEFRKIDPNLKLLLDTTYPERYSGGGNLALIDGVTGTTNFQTGLWQGYQNQDLVATLDFGKQKQITSISTGFLQDQRSWIFYPTKVTYLASQDGIIFNPLYSKEISVIADENVQKQEVNYIATTPTTFRYLKVVAKTLGKLPEWHLGAEHQGTSWIFADEILINE
jgi:predicted alpha-1,2-mannosidase